MPGTDSAGSVDGTFLDVPFFIVITCEYRDVIKTVKILPEAIPARLQSGTGGPVLDLTYL